ncbi:TRAP transporter small permease [Amorphus coralli]|uniref:TRAP transporter small permease n=1 Tax=Amorphus coralli TaxID=340680 RepID=UPI001FE2286D|nr:TRAP transporter small permease [Amorphus coralli]
MTSTPTDPVDGPAPERRLPVLNAILDAIASACMLVAGVMLATLIVIFGWLVFGRYVLNDTPTWVEQASILLIAWITFLGAAVGVRRNTHLNIDFVREAMPRIIRMPLRVIADLYVIVFGAFMAWQGWRLVATNLDRKIPMINISESWRAMPLMICGALMIVFAVALMLGLSRRFSDEA